MKKWVDRMQGNSATRGLKAGLLVFSLGFAMTTSAYAQRVEVKDVNHSSELPDAEADVETKSSSKNKENNADKYFKKSKESESSASSDDHFLAVHLGGFVSGDAFKWGSRDSAENVGKLTLGFTYRFGEWRSSMDLLFRGDFTTYELPDGTAQKLSFLPMLMLPDSSSRFPLYFGAGLGPGVFFKQVRSESNITLDYQLVVGARFFDVIESTGFFVETGLKNHLNLLSDGQFNGVFFSVGALFTF